MNETPLFVIPPFTTKYVPVVIVCESQLPEGENVVIRPVNVFIALLVPPDVTKVNTPEIFVNPLTLRTISSIFAAVAVIGTIRFPPTVRVYTLIPHEIELVPSRVTFPVVVILFVVVLKFIIPLPLSEILAKEFAGVRFTFTVIPLHKTASSPAALPGYPATFGAPPHTVDHVPGVVQFPLFVTE